MGTKKKIKIMYTNADILSNKMLELTERVKLESPDIIMINEVKPKNNTNARPVEAEFKIDERKYKIYSNNLNKEEGRGQIIHVSRDIPHKEIETTNKAKEAMIIELNINKTEKIAIALIYRSPSSSIENNAEVIAQLESICKMKAKSKVIVGDFNFKEIEWEAHQGSGEEQKKLLEWSETNYMQQVVSETTRQRGENRPSRLDLIFTNDIHIIEDINYDSPLGKSDHSTLNFSLRCEVSTIKEIKKKKVYERAKIDDMYKDLESTNWGNTLKIETSDMDMIADNFIQHIEKVEETYIPTITISENKHKRPPKDLTLMELIRKKNKLSREIHKKKLTGNRYLFEESRKEYNRARNKVRTYTRNLRRKYEEKLVSGIKTKPKPVWGYMKSRTKNNTEIGDIREDPNDPKSKLVEEDEEKANIFSKFFKSVQREEQMENFPTMETKEIKSQMPPVDINEKRVERLLKDLNIDKATGPDGMTPKMLKPMAKVLAKPISMIIETSLSRAKLPRIWKIAWIVVIYKKGKKTLACNYRPISLTSIICKIMEKIIRDDTVNHMIENTLFSENQFGFIKGRSTVLQMLIKMDEWTESLDKGLPVDCIYTDFEKAFDTVPHKRLMVKVRAYGINEQVCKWIEDFLSGRQQRVQINGKMSTWEDVISGIPQGSVLGPLLFVIFINDLPDIIVVEIADTNQSKLALFADDSKIARAIRDKIADTAKLQSELHKMKEWTDKWLLRFNPDKLKHIHLNLKGEEPDYSYKVGNDPVKYSKAEKDLGIIVETNLSFEEHINEKVGKARSIWGMVRRAFQFLNIRLFPLLFKGLSRSQLEYGAPVWSPSKMKDIEKIEKVQKQATKQIPGMKDLTYQDRLKKLKMPTLRHRRARGDMIEVYKMLNGLYDRAINIPLKKIRDTRPGARGHSLALHMPRHRLDIRKNSFMHRVVPIWNSLSENTVTSPNINTFKARLDKEWINQASIFDYKRGIEIK